MELFTQRAPWYLAGPLLGLLVVGLLAVANRPLGASGGWIDLVGWIRRPSSGVRVTVFFLIGMIAGGVIFDLIGGGGSSGDTTYGSFDRRLGTTLATRALLLAVAGLLMGFGVRTAGGCTSGHGICGTSLGSRASWVSTVTFMAAAVALTHLALWLGRRL